MAISLQAKLVNLLQNLIRQDMEAGHGLAARGVDGEHVAAEVVDEFAGVAGEPPGRIERHPVGAQLSRRQSRRLDISVDIDMISY